jgi:hypothetical protein
VPRAEDMRHAGHDVRYELRDRAGQHERE